MIKNLILFSFIFSCASPVLAEEKVTFPGQPEAKSPDGQYLILYREIDPKGPDRELLLKRVSDGSTCRIYSFVRNVDVFWTPDSKAIAINDWMVSNVADIIILFPDNFGKQIDLQDLGFSENLQFPKIVDHIYYKALCWKTSRILSFKIYGDGHSESNLREEFEFSLEYTLGDKVMRTISK